MNAPLSRRARLLHRILGLVLLAPLLVWTATGFLFLIKPGWAGAYEMLDAMSAQSLPLANLIAPNDLRTSAEVTRLELGATVLGPVYRVRMGNETQLFNATSSQVLSPLDEPAVLAVAQDAAARAMSQARYGQAIETTLLPNEGVVRFSGGATVRVGRNDLSLSQSGPDTEWINRIYELHYLRWTGVALLDRIAAVAALVGVWVLAAVGLVLLRRGSKRTP